jgi:hypothetical protein
MYEYNHCKKSELRVFTYFINIKLSVEEQIKLIYYRRALFSIQNQLKTKIAFIYTDPKILPYEFSSFFSFPLIMYFQFFLPHL